MTKNVDENLDENLTLDGGRDTFSAIATFVDTLIEAWESSELPPSLGDYLPAAGNVRRMTLVELIKIDLEYRWLNHNLPKHIEEYVDEFPELAQDGVPIDVLYEEFHVRRQAGLNVETTEFIGRFPQQATQLRRLLGAEKTSNSTAMFRPQSTDLLKDLKPGDSFDDFDLLAFLGKGAFASVFLARQNSMQRLVALKISAIRGSEHQTLAQFDHDHIVRVYDQRTLPEHRAQLLYMQYVPGPTLQTVITAVRAARAEQRNGQLLLDVVDEALRERGELRAVESSIRARLATMDWPTVVCWIGSRLAFALDHAHRQGVLHRDVKPANILLTAEASPKLADFNVSFCSKTAGASPAAYFGGSLAYMSPEQLEACNPGHVRDPDSLDGRSDVFSLGVVIWELLLGERPFDDLTVVSNWPEQLQRMVDLRRQGPRPQRLAQSDQYPPGVQSVLRRCLAAEVSDRWQSGAELARRLDLCTDVEVQDYLFPPQGSWRWRVRPFLLFSVLLLTTIPSVLAAIFNFVYNHNEIIANMDSAAETHFMTVQGVINATAFPLGMALVVYVSAYVLRAAKPGPVSSPARLAAARKHGVRLGHYAALVALVLWTLAGLAYPLSMRLGQFSVPASMYTHFFFSLVLCGLFAVSLTFFGVTSLMVCAAIPAILEKQLPRDEGPKLTETVSRWSWIYLAMSASVPMLGTAALVAVNAQHIRAYLAVISVSGIVAFAASVLLFRRLLRDLQSLNRACR